MILLALRAWIRMWPRISLHVHTELTDTPRPGTSHIAAADHTGLAISVITTINLLFGSHLMVPETGIIMNDEMNGMSYIESMLN